MKDTKKKQKIKLNLPDTDSSCFKTIKHEPKCFGTSEPCKNMNPPMCPSVTGNCNDDGTGCVDMFGKPENCEPMEEGDTEVVDSCDPGLFCGKVSETCLEINCINYQKERCPASLKDGTCNDDGSSGCPAAFQCDVRDGIQSTACII